MILCALVFLFILVFNCRLFSFVTRSLRFVLCSRFLVGFWAARRKGAGEKTRRGTDTAPHMQYNGCCDGASGHSQDVTGDRATSLLYG